MENCKVAILVPCYKRPEYTVECIKSLENAQDYVNTTFYLYDDASNDGTGEILNNAKLPKKVMLYYKNHGLRYVVADFLKQMQTGDFDIIGKIDNDSIVPKNFLNDILSAFKNSDCTILSPDNYPSNPAHKLGDKSKMTEFVIPSKHVGGLWFMKKDVIEGVTFDYYDVSGIKGAWNILYQIIQENDPIVGWAYKVVIQDVGHWSGKHPKNIKTIEHERYYNEVGRNIAW